MTMYYFTPETIAQANNQIASLDAKVGGLLCVLSCIGEKIEENHSYTINGALLRKQLSMVFDKTPKDSFDSVKSSYIIFAKNWATTFFTRYIKNRIDLTACAIFFLRRTGFEREYTAEEVVGTFVKRFNLHPFTDLWFLKGKSINLSYNQADVEDNQTGFYSKMNYNNDFKSILFSGVIQKSAADLKAAGQIQTLYSGSGVQTCFLLSDEPLDQYYIMSNSNNSDGKKANNASFTGAADNILLYGVPGCGKSYTIKTEYCNDDNHMERAVFHPDYTYSDFVGQILPKIDEGHVEYSFEPGPFTRILKKAVKSLVESPDERFYLVVEEINRGNAPAIFGDLFQLLDRDESGCSEYGISNENISSYVYGDTTTKIKIPGNLFVLATMNTSDQNVFTLDTAFKRRWTMRMIENNIDACKYADHQICAWDITWGSFAKTINKKITELGENNLSNEDNRLGAYFVREADLNNAERFGEKILMYLWNDAFKFDHDKVFKAEYRTLDELITGFIRVGFAVFSDDIVFETIAEETGDIVETDNPTVEQYLEGKNPGLVAAYRTLFEAVTSRIPNAYDASVGSLTYAAWRANDIRKASFADIVIQRNRIVISCEVPASEAARAVGEQIPVDNHHNHYFRIIFDAEQTEQVVEAIVDSYNQLKVQ